MIISDVTSKIPPFKYNWNEWDETREQFESELERTLANQAPEFDVEQALYETGTEMYRLQQYNHLYDSLRDQIGVVEILIVDADPNKPPWSANSNYIRYYSKELGRDLTYQEMARQIIVGLLNDWQTLNQLRERVVECWPYRYTVDNAGSYMTDYPIPDDAIEEDSPLGRNLDNYGELAASVDVRWERLSHDMARFLSILYTLADSGKIFI